MKNLSVVQTTGTVLSQLEIKDQIKDLQALIIRKELSEIDLNAREQKKTVISLITSDLMTVSKVFKATLAVVRLLNSEECILPLLTERQLKTFKYNQFTELVKSHALILRVAKSLLTNDDVISVNQYFNMIIKNSCLTTKSFDERKKRAAKK